MKKIILNLILGIVLLSCATTKPLINGEKIFLNTYPIKNSNEIERLYIKDLMDLKNNEINLYHIKNLKIEGIPKLSLDINYEKGISDSFIIENVNEGKIILSLNNLGNNKTIKKDIIIARLPENSKLEFKLENEYQVIDNTMFDIVEIEKNGYKWIKLSPYFLDEDTFEKKIKEVSEKEVNVAFYENNTIFEYNYEKIEDNVKYRNVEAKLGNAKNIKGYGQPGSEIILEFDKFTISTLVNSDGKWSTMIPESYTGNLKVKQKSIINGKTIFTEAKNKYNKRNGE